MRQVTNNLTVTPTPENTIICDRARFVLLTDRLVRLPRMDVGRQTTITLRQNPALTAWPALAAMLPRLGHGVSSWEPSVNPQRVAVCKKALDIFKAAVPELAGGGRRG